MFLFALAVGFPHFIARLLLLSEDKNIRAKDRFKQSVITTQKGYGYVLPCIALRGAKKYVLEETKIKRKRARERGIGKKHSTQLEMWN